MQETIFSCPEIDKDVQASLSSCVTTQIFLQFSSNKKGSNAYSIIVLEPIAVNCLAIFNLALDPTPAAGINARYCSLI